jgi:amino acid adenylation domain-containing protein
MIAAGSTRFGVVGQFEAAVRDHPEVVALEHAGEAVTYRELGERVFAVAARLAGAGPRVGVCVGKSLTGPVAYLGVLASGRCVVPVSPRTPSGRLAGMMAAADLREMVTDGHAEDDLVAAWSADGVDVIDAREVAAGPAGVPHDGGDEAYVLFTSGSTGVPKGVRIPHTAVSAYVDHVTSRAGLGTGCRLTHNFELTFDPSVFDLLAALTTGATLVIPDASEAANPVHYVNHRAITHWYSVPSVISVARQMRLLTAGSMPDLVWSSFIGEPLTLDQARAWSLAAPNSLIENVYGPTELTVSCTEYVLPADHSDWPSPVNGTVPIGLAYPHLQWCLVDEGQLVEDEGELCMRGSQRLTSYLDTDDNRGRFFLVDGTAAREPDVDSPVPDNWWYRTGDRVRLDHGQLVHIGRLDRQVKVRGFRIELAEVEQHVRRLAGVLDAAAVTVDVPTGRVIVVCYTGSQRPAYDLRVELADTMPTYMNPERFVHVADLPRNDRGKTDYRRVTELVSPSPERWLEAARPT